MFSQILIYILKTLKIGIQIGIQISKKFANYACMAQQVAHSLGKEKPSTKIIPKILICCCGTVGSALPW